MKRIHVIFLLVALLAFAGAGCGGGSDTVPGDAVAVVDGEEIPKSEYDSFIAQSKRSYKLQKRKFPAPGTDQYKAIRDQIMGYLVEREQFEQKAEELDVEVSDEDVDKRLEQIKKQYFGSQPGKKRPSKAEIEKRYQAQLKQQGLSDEQVHDVIHAQLVREAVFKKVTADVKVSPQEIRKYYNQHKSQYAQPANPESREARHILVKANQKALADQIYAQLTSNPNAFAGLARKHSIDTQTKPSGGKLPGGVFRGRTVPPFDKVVFRLQVREISRPVKTQYGWHIIQALGPIRPGTPAKPTPFTQVREAIRQQLLQTKRQNAMTKWLERTKKDFAKKIKYQTGYALQTATGTTGTTTAG